LSFLLTALFRPKLTSVHIFRNLTEVLVGNAEAEDSLYADNVMRKLMDKQASTAVRSAVDSDDETLLMCLQASDMESARSVVPKGTRLDAFNCQARVARQR